MTQVFIVTKPLESFVCIGNHSPESLQHWGVVVNSSDNRFFEATRSELKVKVKKILFKNSQHFDHFAGKARASTSAIC